MGTSPLKINMEPKNHLFETENHVPNLHLLVQNVNFSGCTKGGKHLGPFNFLETRLHRA